MNPLVTIIENLEKIPNNYFSLNQVLTEIISDKHKLKVEKIRNFVASGKVEEASKIKKTLPAFISTGQFLGGRKKENNSVFSNIVVLDFDHIIPDQYDHKFSKACSLPTTIASFRSPGGKGMKVLVPYSGGKDHYEIYYMQVAEFYRNELGIDFDPKCKDISRLCFFSYDPHLYKNLECDVFQVVPCPEIEIEVTEVNEIPKSTLNQEPLEILFKKAELRTKKICKYEDGSRNNFIFLLACNCVREGILISDAQKSILLKYKYDKLEIETTINSAYENESRVKKNPSVLKESLFSIYLLNIKRYNPNVEPDKRIFFEALIIKAISFGKEYYLTREMILNEMGIKKDRAKALVNDFKELGLITVQVRKSTQDGLPRQKTYFTVHPERIIETSKILFRDNTEFVRKITPLLIGNTFN